MILGGLQHPARLVPLGFLAAILVGTGLLMLPLAHADDGGAPLLVALFTATSAICVTGLVVVDTPTYWSGFGQGVILVLFQVGGFGIMTGATLLTLVVTRRLGIGSRLIAQAETKGVALGDVASILRFVLILTLLFEVAVSTLVSLRLHYAYDVPPMEALWHGVFQAVSAFNNAGFSTYSDSLMQFALDPMILLPIMVAVIVGGLGFPVLHELSRGKRRPLMWSVHTKITLLGTVLLLLAGTAGALVYEWSNPGTLGPLDVVGKVMNAASHSVMARTAGFNSIDVGAMQPETWALTYALMFIGGGSAGTAGGIKVTTFLLLGFAVWSEIRGHKDVNAFGRRISQPVQRQALAVVLLALTSIGAGTLVLLSVTDFPLDQVLFEVISAFATVGLSTGITAELPAAAQVVIIILMFVGRVGTITVATALALNRRPLPYRFAEERPIVG